MRTVSAWIRGFAVAAFGWAGVVSAQGVFPPPEQFPDLRLEVAGTVNAIARYDDGSNVWYLIGGDFVLVNGMPRRNLARLNANGTLDSAWRADTDGTVNALALSGDRLFVGGEFTRVDGLVRTRLARVDADDGVTDPNWAPAPNAVVYALQADASSIWAAGRFTAIGPTARRMVARIDAANASLPAFNAGFTGSVAWSLLLDGGDLYIGGEGKVKAQGNQRGLMKVGAASGSTINWNPGIKPNGGARVRTLGMDATTVYAGGRIRRAGGNTTRGNAARFLKSDASLQPWNPPADAEVLALAVDAASSSVFLAGDFLNLSGRQRLARVDATTGAASAGFSANADRNVNALLVDGGGVIVGGNFTRIGAATAQGGLARLAAATGASDVSFVGDAAGRGTVSGFAFDADGGVILGGAFDAARPGGETTLYSRSNVLRLLPGTMQLDLGWTINVTGEVGALAVDGNTLFLGGNFTAVQGAARTRLAKLAADTGALDTQWTPTADAPVRRFTLDAANDRLYVAGDFTTLGGQLFDGLGRLSTSAAGAVDTSWNPAPDDVVDAILVSGANVYLGGAFGVVGGANRAGLARVSVATGLADTFSADVDAAGAVNALAETPDGLYVGGRFSSLGGQPRNGTGRVVGGAVDSWHPDVGAGGVLAIAVDDAEGSVYLGGDFSMAGGEPHPNLARAPVAAPGTADAAWRPGTDDVVRQLAMTPDGDVLAAGAFNTATGLVRTAVARFAALGSDTTQIEITTVTPVGGSTGSNSVYGQDYVVGFSVTNVDDPGTAPTGTVTVTASTGESCSAAAFAGGCTLTPDATGARTLVAVFTGDPMFLDSTSDAVPHTVDPATLVLTLASAPFPSALNASADAQITVQVPAPGAQDPSGTVTVTVDGGAGCSIVLPDTSCTLPAFNAFGYYTLEASYTDDATPAHHAADAVNFEHAVGTVTTLDLTVPATATVGVAVTASVVTTAIPDGSTVTVTGGQGCSITVNSNAGSCQLTFNASGTIPVVASYAGNNDLLPAQDASNVVAVDVTATTLDVSIAPPSPFAGQPATINITTNLPSGTVQIGGAPGCTQIVRPATSCSASFPAAGPVTVTASFAGNAQFGPASDSANATVQLNATSLDVAIATASPVVGQPVAVTLTTNLPNGTAIAITGAPGCTQIVRPASGCSATYTAPGAINVGASFAGNGQFAAANDAAASTVSKASTTFVDFVASPSIGVPGDTITFLWEVGVVAPGNAAITGNVEVSLEGTGGAPSCQAPVEDGACSILFADEGLFAMQARYLGNANLLASASSDASIGIQQAAPTDSDLMIEKTVSRSRFDGQGEEVEFMIVVGNAGPAAVAGAPIADVLPAGLSSADWTCTPDGPGASCSVAGGSGSVAVTADLAANATVTVLLTATVDANAPDVVANTATVSAPQGANDPSTGNNSSTTFYQTCPGNAGATLSEHVCLFRDGFEGN